MVTNTKDAPQVNGGRSRPSFYQRAARESFQAQSSINQKKKSQEVGHAVGITPLYLGIAISVHDDRLDIGFASHDATYSIDFAIKHLQTKEENRAEQLANYLIKEIGTYREDHLYKFLGAGLSQEVFKLSPELPARLWMELDIHPIVLEQKHHYDLVDEEADAMARRCVDHFGPTSQPRLMIGFRNQVQVDRNGLVQISSVNTFKHTVGSRTWDATMKYAQSLKENNIRIAFFNATPQGGGVALMRHALIRYLNLIGVQCTWHVPRPNPAVFRITKNNHNILQGVAEPELRLSQNNIQQLDEFVEQNVERYWSNKDGPLAPPEEGGAHIIIVDDPQMPKLVELSKQIAPDRPVIFRSHIQVRADLADQDGTPTAEVWKWIQERIQKADLFISHPVREFVPKSVDTTKVGYMPATTDWLDGLNKELDHWNNQFYLHEFDTNCHHNKENPLEVLEGREYFVQIARFDPAKGIPDLLAAYAEFRRKYLKDVTDKKGIPQLVIAGHSAIDDPDATAIFDQTKHALDTKYADVKDDVVVMRIGPTDQILNVLMSNALVALQLSTREGFEVKVSEALHKGIPIIATKAGGIPLQVQDGKNGFLVEPGDSSAVAKYLNTLWTDRKKRDEMADYAHKHVSDEVSTVGNALCWLYLADKLCKGEKVEPHSAWISDMAREEAGLPWEEGENRLPRPKKLNLEK